MIWPPVGKSGPLMYRSRSLLSSLRSSIRATAASHTSPRLWGGMLVAMPTAMPAQPLASKCGMRAGNTRALARCRRSWAGNPPCLLDLVEQLSRQRRQACLGVAVGGRCIAVERSEIAVPVHQPVTQREVLSHAHHGVVAGAIAVRMVLAYDRAHDGRALAKARVGVEVQVGVHGEEDPPLHGLEPVAYIRQGARRDDADRVVEIAALRLFGQIGVSRRRWFVAATLAPAAATPALALGGGRTGRAPFSSRRSSCRADMKLLGTPHKTTPCGPQVRGPQAQDQVRLSPRSGSGFGVVSRRTTKPRRPDGSLRTTSHGGGTRRGPSALLSAFQLPASPVARRLLVP